MRRWKGEPRAHADIKHVDGCISPAGCRCAAYEHINPPQTLPEYLRDEGHWLNAKTWAERDATTSSESDD